MIFALWMILLAGLLPYAVVGYAKYDKNFDNHTPRQYLEKTKGAKKRAYWAHLNSFEVFPLFAAAVLVAYVTGADTLKMDILAGLFVLSRIAYIGCYITDKATLRSVSWAIGLACIVGLFII